MNLQFRIANWSAWAPNLTSPAHWLEWSKGQREISGNAIPALAAMPTMQRRRVSGVGRMALEVAYACAAGKTNIPTIFCSRHGETLRSVEMIQNYVRGEALSPTAFSLSVHNAVGGLFSIARQDQAACTAIAAGKCSVANAVVEACGWLEDGAAEVLLINYDAPLPKLLAEFADEPELEYAWAWRLSKREGELISLQLANEQAHHQESMQTRPAGLDVLDFVIANRSLLLQADAGKTWTWSRCADAA